MALPVTIPNTFANATASIPLSQLDTNFNTLANAVNGISDGSETLANASVTVLTAGTVDINGGAIDGTTVGTSNAAAGSFTTLNTSGAVVFNDAGADVDFRVEGDTEANLLFVDASTDRVGIGTNTPTTKLQLAETGGSTLTFERTGTADGNGVIKSIGNTGVENARISFGGGSNNALIFSTGSSATERMRIDSSGKVLIGQTASRGTVAANLQVNDSRISITGATNGIVGGLRPLSSNSNSVGIEADPDNLVANSFIGFHVDATERMRIDSSGNLLVGMSVSSSTVSGVRALASGTITATRDGDTPAVFNRLTDDGTLVDLRQGSTSEGTISVSGNTVSYNPFLGSHSGALADWSKPEIKIGTVMDTIDELLEYKVVVIDVQEEVPAKEAVLDEEGNEVEPAQEATTKTVQKRISYNGNGAVGSSATVEYEGQEYTGTIQNEREDPLSFNKHLKVKINDTAASKAVFGVFVGWNNDSNNDGGVYNDMLVGAVGNYVIRMAAGQEPQIGDLVEADGNGCAVVQDDDIIRTKTVAKVTSTIKQLTYDDGSFLVTCVLYCG